MTEAVVPEVRIDPLSGLRAIVGGHGAVAGNPGDEVRVVSGPEAVLSEDAPPVAAEANRDLFWAGPAAGAQERIALPAGAGRSLSELDPDQLAAAMEAWRERMRAHPDAACLHLSVDDGVAGDGDPVRAQLFALEFVPAAVARERERFGAHATRTMGGNLLADLVQEEVRRRERIVAIDEDCVLMAPFGARVPYQLLIAPRAVRARFEDEGPTGAHMLHDALGRLARRFGTAPPLTLWVRTAPRGAEYFCWRIDILPRLARGGGLELGVGVGLNPVAPERAAAELREL